VTPALLTIADAARHLCVSVSTLHRHKDAGRVAYVKLGGKVLFRVADLEAFVERSRVADREPVSDQPKRATPSAYQCQIF
jgi:excisionase family DNA binding protein